MSRNILFLILIGFLLGAGCASGSNNPVAATATSAILSPTLPSQTLPAPSETPFPPPPQPTAAPVEGITSTQLNVRAEPSTAGTVLGVIPANTKVQISGKDPAGNWWQILYPQGEGGKGWVTAQYVSGANKDAVPVVGGGANPNDESVAVVQEQINVRSGPGTGFNSLGTLNAQDVVNLTGKDASSTWLQIEFPAGSGPDGKGWVNAAFVRATGVEALPIITEAGEMIGTGTPTIVPFTPTPTVAPAWEDQDTQANPIASIVFDPLGTQALIYKGDVSTPEGDSEDWLQFTPDQNKVYAGLECGNQTGLQVSLLENGQPASVQLACGDREKEILVQAGAVYVIRLQAPQFSGGLQYIPYTVTIRSSPE